ncbi:MAG TPA: DUF2341 domain-containing protein [Methanomicrobiales archaeon]|nr:DUF2341 domain-containing protein [Methanomicrobiales archaeon]
MDHSGVSEIIGTLVLVGIVVIGIVLAALLLFSHPAATKVPVFDCIISNQSNTIYLYHRGGDSLSAGEYRILVDGVDRTANFTFMSPGTEPWSVGETLTGTMASLPRHVTIVFVSADGEATAISQADLVPVLEVPPHLPNYPMVAWSNSPAFGNITTLFQFTDASSVDNLTSYFWNFNDANISSLRSTSHVFPCVQEYCTYEIDHGVTDSGNTSWAATAWLNRSAWVTVYKNLTPTVTFTQDRTGGPLGMLSTISFTATPYGAIRVDSWYWTFGDSGTSTSQNPSHAYTAEGTYTVTLTATNYTLGQNVTMKTNLIQVTAPWPSCSWPYRKKIILNHAKVPATLTNFTVLISLTDNDLKNRQPDGNDIVFTSSDGTTKLFHEVEAYTSSTGTLVAWVKIPTLSSATDTILYMYYNNAGLSTQQDPPNAWDPNYMTVWHLNAGTSGSGAVKDSTGYLSGTGNGGLTLVNGMIDKGFQFDGTSGYVRIDNSATGSRLDFTGGPFTISTWFKMVDVATSRHIFGKRDNNMKQYQMGVGTLPDVFISNNTNQSWGSTLSTSYPWYYYAWTVDSAGWPSLYLNGSLDPTWGGDVRQPWKFTHEACDATIGARWTTVPTTAAWYKGILDEIRVSNVSRTENWLTTEYNTENSPSTFFSNTTEENSGCQGVGLPTFVQKATPNQFTNKNTPSITLSNVVAGDLIVVSINWTNNARTISSVKDGNNNNYALANGPTTWAGSEAASTYYYANAPSGANTITVTFSGNTYGTIYAAEYSGVNTSGPIDKTASSTGTGTALNSGSGATAVPKELVYGFCASRSTASPAFPYTARDVTGGNFIADNSTWSMGTYSVTGTSTAGTAWVCQMATFKGT